MVQPGLPALVRHGGVGVLVGSRFRGRRHGVLTSIGAVVMACTACTGGGEASQPPEAEEVRKAQHSPPHTAVPGTTSGELDQSDLPAPVELGPGWEYRVDPGDAEEGYAGNGTPAIARDPAEVLGAITPLGCRPADLPLPRNALEVTYAKGERPGVALMLAFDDAPTAQRFFDVHSRTLRQCAQRPTSPLAIVTDDPGQISSSRTEFPGETHTWDETMTVSDNRVVLVALA